MPVLSQLAVVVRVHRAAHAGVLLAAALRLASGVCVRCCGESVCSNLQSSGGGQECSDSQGSWGQDSGLAGHSAPGRVVFIATPGRRGAHDGELDLLARLRARTRKTSGDWRLTGTTKTEPSAARR